MISFTTNNGYLDGIVRGYRGALLATSQYTNLSHCETLDDFCVQLATTDYGESNHGSVSNNSELSIKVRIQNKFVHQFRYLKENAARGSTLFELLERIQHGYMIDNAILLLTGTSDKSLPKDNHNDEEHYLEHQDKDHENLKLQREEELISQCHPLGLFDALPALTVVSQAADDNWAQFSILQDSPIGHYLPTSVSRLQNFELLRGQMWRLYLEDFHKWSRNHLDTVSGELMCNLLENEADRRILSIAVNSLSAHGLSKEDRFELFPRLGMIYEQGIAYRLARADDLSAVKSLIDQHPILSLRFPLEASSSLEQRIALEEVHDCKLMFEFPNNHAVFYAWSRLKEQEGRNLVWIGECIAQKRKESVNDYIPIW